MLAKSSSRRRCRCRIVKSPSKAPTSAALIPRPLPVVEAVYFLSFTVVWGQVWWPRELCARSSLEMRAEGASLAFTLLMALGDDTGYFAGSGEDVAWSLAHRRGGSLELGQVTDQCY